jgi:hypothetical protein
MLPLGTISRYTKNPRRKQNIEKLAASITRYGWRQPIVVDKKHVIIVGDTRYLAAEWLGESHVPVWVAADMTEAEAVGYRLADNRLADEAEWDEGMLTAELQLLESFGLPDLEEATGFDTEELEQLLTPETATITPLVIAKFPPYTWVLIGVPTGRYADIAEHVEAISILPDSFVEVTANDAEPPARR